MRKLINFISAVGIIGLFAWISFFAPILTGEIWRFRFLSTLVILSAILVCLDVGFYRKLIFNKEDIPFWIFLLTMAGGLVNATNRVIAYQYFWSFIFTIPFLYFFAKAAFLEECGMIILRAICFMGLVICILGIIEVITRENFMYTKLMINNFCYSAFRGNRMMSAHIHPAPLGTYLVAIFPATIVLILKEKKVFLKSLAVFYAAIIFISIVLTFSRGAFLGFFMGTLIMLFFLLRRKKDFFISVLILSALGIAIVLISLLFKHSYLSFYRFSLNGLFFPYNYSSKLDRVISISKILRDHPFFGLGFGNYSILFDHYLPHLAEIVRQLSKVPDCVYILLLTETGIVGFTGFVLFIFFLFKKILCGLKSLPKNEDRLLLVGFLAGFIGILCAFLTYDALYWTAPAYLFWSYAGIMTSLSSRAIKNNG